MRRTFFQTLRSPGSWPLALKMSLDLFLAVCLPLGLAVWYTAVQGRRELERSAEQGREELERSSGQNLQLLAGVTSARLDQLLLDSSQLAAKVARDDGVIARCQVEGEPSQAVADAVQRDLKSTVETNPGLASIFLVGRDGRGVAGTNARNVGMDFSFREYAGEALAGRAHVSDPIVGKTTSEVGVYISSPVRAPEAHTVIGAVVIKLDGERLREIVNAVKVGERGFTMLADRNGVVLSHPQKDHLFRSFAPLSPEAIARINPEKAYSRASIDSLDMHALQGPATAEESAGTQDFTMGSGREQRRWVAGCAGLTLKRWRVFVVEPEEQFAAATTRLAQQLEAATTRLLRQELWIGLIVTAVAAVLVVWRAQSVVRPVLAVTHAAERVAAGDLKARAPRFADDEVGRLAARFNEMVPQLQERAQLQQALAVATEVQQALLPEKDPIHPCLEVAGRSRYCDETGGDYYDFIEVIQPGGKELLIAVGDVTGHGIAAALLMAEARGAVRAHADRGSDLPHVLGRVNRVLSEDSRHSRFMTLALFVLDPEAGTLRWVSAGHDPPFIYHATEARFEELKGSNLLLGVEADMEYVEYRREGLRSGDLIFVGTDGIWEMFNSKREQFGKDRLRRVLEEHHSRSCADIAAAVEKALVDFRGLAAPEDDVTFVVVKLK